MKKESSFKMKGFSGFGNSPIKAKASPAENLLKAVPNEKAYDKLSDIDKKGFDKAAKKAGLPTKKSPAKLVKAVGRTAAKAAKAVSVGAKKVKKAIAVKTGAKAARKIAAKKIASQKIAKNGI